MLSASTVLAPSQKDPSFCLWPGRGCGPAFFIPVYEEVGLGTAEIRQVFHSSKFGSIAGSIVRSGTIKRGAKARLVRGGVVLAGDLSVETLRREKDDVTEVREGYECGINLGFKDLAEGDVIETWEMREKPRD